MKPDFPGRTQIALIAATGLCLLLTGATLPGLLSSKRRPMVSPEEGNMESVKRRTQWFNRFRLQGLAPGDNPAALLRKARMAVKAMPRLQGGNFILPGHGGPTGPGMPGGGNPALDYWVSAGPQPLIFPDDGSNLSGRGTVLAPDLKNDPSGNTLYYGTPLGGLWKSTNALSDAASFTNISDPGESPAVASIALDSSSNPPAIYIGTGDADSFDYSYYGVGILRSGDGGAHWTLSSTATAPSGSVSLFGLAITRILVDPGSQVVLASAVGMGSANTAVLSPGIFRSPDGGASWAQVPDLAGQNVSDLAYDPDQKTYYAAAEGLGVYASTNQGQNWQALPSPFAGATPVNSSNFLRTRLTVEAGVLYAMISDANGLLSKPTAQDTGLVESQNGGAGWSALSTPPEEVAVLSYCDYLVAPAPGALVIPTTASSAYTAQVKATGTSWTAIGYPHADHHALAALDASRWFMATDGGLYYTPNAGATWVAKNDSFNTLQFYSVSPDSGLAGYIAGGAQDNGLDAGQGSTAWVEGPGGDGQFVEADPDYAGEYYGSSVDHGWSNPSDLYHWVPGNFLLVAKLDTASYFTVIPQSNPLTLVGIVQGQLTLGPASTSSPNEGWKAVSPATGVGWIAAAPGDENTLYYTFNNTIEKTVNLFAPSPSWTSQAPFNDNLEISAIAVSPSDTGTIYVAKAGYSDGQKVFVSHDSGASFTNVSGNLPNCPMNWIAVDPVNPSAVYVASDAGVFYAGDGGVAGESWSVVGDNLPNTPVLQVKVSDTSPRQLVAATYGRGAWTFAIAGNPLPVASPEPTGNPKPSPTYCPVKGDIWEPAPPPFVHSNMGAAVFQNQICMVGGLNANGQETTDFDMFSVGSTEWSSSPAEGAVFSPRENLSAVAFDPGDGAGQRLFVLGGETFYPKLLKYQEYNDVWATANGYIWGQATPHAGFSPRSSAAGLVFNGFLWMIGGDSGDDAWYSNEGAQWFKAASHIGSPKQTISHAVVLNGSLWAISDGDASSPSNANHVWSSYNGSDWTPVKVAKGFPPRESFACLTFGNQIWVMGGYQPPSPQHPKGQVFDDLWYSEDGAHWTQVKYLSAAAYSPHSGQAGLVFNGQMWMFGGKDGSGNLATDAWTSSCDKGKPIFPKVTTTVP